MCWIEMKVGDQPCDRSQFASGGRAFRYPVVAQDDSLLGNGPLTTVISNELTEIMGGRPTANERRGEVQCNV